MFLYTASSHWVKWCSCKFSDCWPLECYGLHMGCLLQHWCLQFAVDQYVKVKWLLGWWLLFPPFFSLRLPLAGLVGLRDGYKSAVTDLFNLWPSWWRWLITSELENTSNKNTTLLAGWKRECNMLICLFVFRVSILYKYVYYCCCPDHYKNCLS